MSADGKTISAPGARWVNTLCDGCHHGGLWVLVPVAADGRARAVAFPALCAACLDVPATRERAEQQARAT